MTVSIELDSDQWEALRGSCSQPYGYPGDTWPEALHGATPAQCAELDALVDAADSRRPLEVPPHLHLALRWVVFAVIEIVESDIPVVVYWSGSRDPDELMAELGQLIVDALEPMPSEPRSLAGEPVPRVLHTQLTELRALDDRRITHKRWLDLETLACHLHVRPGDDEHACLTDPEARPLLAVLVRTYAGVRCGLLGDRPEASVALAQRDSIVGPDNPLTEPCLVLSPATYRALWRCLVLLDIRSREVLGEALFAGLVDSVRRGEGEEMAQAHQELLPYAATRRP